MSLSELCCVLLVSVPVMKVLIAQIHDNPRLNDAVQLLTSLQSLAALTYWWPEKELDGPSAEEFVQRNKEEYFSSLKSMSKRYVQDVHRTCGKYTELRKSLDKPNLHRLIEMYEHTIPSFGHAREFMELVFGAAHQPLKRCFTQSNNKNAHISAVEHCVGNDWQGRLNALYSDAHDSDDSTRLEARRGIRRLLLGEEADRLDEQRDKQFINETDDTLLKLLRPALERQMRRDARVANFGVSRKAVWKGRGATNIKGLVSLLRVDKWTLKGVVQHATRWITALYPQLSVGEEPEKIEVYKGAKRVRLTKSGHDIGRTYKHDYVEATNVVQAYMDYRSKSDKTVSSSLFSDAKPYVFIIIAVLQRGNDQAWAICMRCQCTRDTIQIHQKLDAGSFQLLLLSPDVRRIAVYHICQEKEGAPSECEIDPKRRVVSYSISVLDGARMYIQRGVNGYPPRMA